MIAVLLFIMGFAVLVAAVAGLAIHDIRTAKMQRAVHKHPSAKRWRHRPAIVLDTETMITDEQLKILRKGYRKISTITPTNSPFVLTVTDGTVIGKTAIRDAVQRFNYDESLSTVAILPMIQQPETTWQLLSHYKVIATTPFRILCAELGIGSTPSLTRTGSLSQFTRAYFLLTYALKVLSFAILLYALYAAIAFLQPEYLLTYALALYFWIVWTVMRYPHLTFAQKSFYIALAPASFVRFVIDACTAPFRLGGRQVMVHDAIIR